MEEAEVAYSGIFQCTKNVHGQHEHLMEVDIVCFLGGSQAERMESLKTVGQQKVVDVEEKRAWAEEVEGWGTRPGKGLKDELFVQNP